jgi:hypothetical protein
LIFNLNTKKKKKKKYGRKISMAKEALHNLSKIKVEKEVVYEEQ